MKLLLHQLDLFNNITFGLDWFELIEMTHSKEESRKTKYLRTEFNLFN